MKKTGLILLLTAVSTGAMAEWILVGENAGVSVYADPSTSRKNGTTAKMQYLIDNKKTQTEDEERSTVGLGEYDCVEKKARNIRLSLYSGNMGTGKVMFSGPGSDTWIPVLPTTFFEPLLNLACGKAKLHKR